MTDLRLALTVVLTVAALAEIPVAAQQPRPKPAAPRPAPRAEAAPVPAGTLLVIADADCVLLIDGTEIGEFKAGTPRPARVSLGQHLVQARAGDAIWQEVVTVKSSEQVVLQVPLAATRATREADRRKAEEDERRAREEAAEARRSPRERTRDIARRALEAMGGADLIRGIRTAVFESQSSNGTRAVYYYRLPNDQRAEFYGGGTLEIVSVQANGSRWTRYPRAARTDVTPSAPIQLPVIGRLLRIADGELMDASASTQGAETLVVASDFEATFDTTSGLLRRVRSKQNGETKDDHHAEYRPVQGVLWPFKTQTVSPGSSLTSTYLRVEFNRELSPSLFEKP